MKMLSNKTNWTYPDPHNLKMFAFRVMEQIDSTNFRNIIFYWNQKNGKIYLSFDWRSYPFSEFELDERKYVKRIKYSEINKENLNSKLFLFGETDTLIKVKADIQEIVNQLSQNSMAELFKED